MVASLLACGLIVLNSTDPPGTLPFDLHARRLASLIFVPSFNERGLLQPIIGPGWTLNYEAMFYACFALVLLLGRRLAFLKLAAVLASPCSWLAACRRRAWSTRSSATPSSSSSSSAPRSDSR